MVSDLSWLPDRHLPVAATLAHADELIERVCDLAFSYSDEGDGPLSLAEVLAGPVSHATVTHVRPLPRAVALYVADALTTLRAAIEHTLYAEVEHAAGRELTAKEARSIEMPTHTTAENFDKWVRDRKSKGAPAWLQLGSPLVGRIRTLQPYHLRKTPDEHPMRVLSEHTNLAKHRMPVLAAARIGRLIPDFQAPGVIVNPPTGEPVRAGDVLATTPLGTRVPVSVFPTIAVRRPHTGQWPVLVNELTWLATWTRTVAVPVLVTGGTDVDALPARYDTTVGYDDDRAALAAGTASTAAERLNHRIQVSIVRADLPEILALDPSHTPRALLAGWVASLDDESVLERMSRLQPGVGVTAMRRTAAVAAELVAEARAHRGDQG